VLTGQHRFVEIDSAATTGFVLVLLYLRGPLGQLSAALPLFGRAQVSVRKLTELSEAFADAGEPVSDESPPPATSFDLLELRGVR
ncbi:hypothetical protein R0K19_25600, partial [Bacillus sp. SIMBA_161]